ncbi:esiB [Symbiodinium sp. CCMP2592]|nr:esiB [Symbiodinium sp. CCMP2592]
MHDRSTQDLHKIASSGEVHHPGFSIGYFDSGLGCQAEGVVSQGDYEIWSKKLVVCRKEKSRIILWSGLGSEVEREDVLWPLRSNGRGCIIHSRREPDTKLGEILNDPQVNVLEACPWSAVKPFWDGASRAFAGSWAARGGAENYSIVLGHDAVGRIFDTILYKAELKALAESAQEGLRVDVLFTAAMSLEEQAVLSSILYHRTRLLSPMREEEFDATTWQYGGCPKDELASCVPEHLLEPSSTQLQRLIDKAKEAEAHYGGVARKAERPTASVADGRCQQQLDALTALITETCQEDAQRGSPVSVGGCQAEAEGVVNLGDFEVWSKSLVACGEDKLDLLLWSGFKEEEREEVLRPLRRRGGCALQTKAPEDTTLAKLLNDERVKVLQDCPWKVTKPFWDGASRNFVGMWASRGRDYSRWVEVIVAMGYHSDPARSHKTMFNTVFFRSELKALAQASLGALAVRLVFTNPGMNDWKMTSATAVAFERARLLSPLGKASFKRKTEWQISDCSGKKRDLGSCAERGHVWLLEPDSGRATISLALMYRKGWGVRQDDGKAVELLQKSAELLQKSAELGNSVAMFDLGSMYDAGDGVQKNHSKAVELYEQAARRGDAASMFNLGLIDGGKQNYNKAVEWFQEAANRGLVEAMFKLGYMYYRGIGVQKNQSKALALLQNAADLGNADAMFILGRMYNFGEGVEQNGSKAAQLYSKAADLGTDDASGNLGVIMYSFANLAKMYYNGAGVEQNYSKAAQLYGKAADLGDADAMLYLGNMYHSGEGVEHNDSKAAQLYSKAADLGNADAFVNLGVMYYDGAGVEQNYSKAAQLYGKAADLGNADAMRNLGNMYHFGEGVEHNDSKAAQLYSKAADLGNADAFANLAVLHYVGAGVEQNYSKAAQLYGKAADLGDADSMFNLGRMYYFGLGVQQNYTKAAEWLQEAADLGNAEAMFMLGSMCYDGRGFQVNHTKAAEFCQRAADIGHVQAMLTLGRMYHEGDGLQADYAKSAELFHKAEALQNLQSQSQAARRGVA